MSNLFGNLKADGLEEAQDRLGGFSRLESDAYPVTFKALYAGKSSGGAQNVTILADINGREYSETIYITNRKGENWFENKDKDGKPTGKKSPLPGFTVIDDICLVTTGKPLCEQATEEKVLNVYDPEQKKEMPKSVQVLTDVTGTSAILGIIKQTVNKSEKNGDEYVLIADTREENFTDKVFEVNSRATVVEAKKAAETGQELSAVFYGSWVEKNRGKTRDARKIKDGEAGQSGRPGRPAGGPPQQGQTQQRKSLFG
jgi:hypothetical protein